MGQNLDVAGYSDIALNYPYNNRTSAFPLPLNNINITVKDAEDPYFMAYYLTEKTLDFGLTSK